MENQKFICQLCGKKFQDFTCFRSHLKNKEKISYTKYINIIGPFRKIYKKNKFQCQICGLEFSTFIGLGKHINCIEKIKTKFYYDKYLKKENEEYCNDKNCSKKVKFFTIKNGYSEFCRKCSLKYIKYKNNNYNKKKKINFINKAKKIRKNLFNYNKVNYLDRKTKIQIWCFSCKKYIYVTPEYHLKRRYGCPSCKEKAILFDKLKRTKNFLEKTKIIHSDCFDLSKVNYINDYTLIKIWCKNCKKYFKQKPGQIISGVGCPFCVESKNERKIRIWFEQNNIKYEYQKRFKNCKNKRPLPFDFYLPIQNMCIEYDGEQHYDFRIHRSKNQKKSFEKLQFHDNIKNHFCINNNIKLLRIPFWEKDNIENILEKNILLK